jgi:hypothetical protein
MAGEERVRRMFTCRFGQRIEGRKKLKIERATGPWILMASAG